MKRTTPDSKSIQTYLEKNLVYLGPNKRREITRLLFEIAKREKRSFLKILPNIPQTRPYAVLKNYLLDRRFPSLHSKTEKTRLRLPDIRLEPRYRVKITTPPPYKHFYIESAVLDSDLVKRLKDKFSASRFSIISTYKDFISGKSYDLADYNRRAKKLFIVKESFDFFHPCPCTPHAVRCGYQNMKLGWGCPFECVYCFLPSYVNSPGMVVPANIGDFFQKFRERPIAGRLGTGQFTDSLVFDDITGYSAQLIDFFRDYPRTIFEFKTKSDNIGVLIRQKPAGNVVVSWSLNPQNIITQTEFYTADLCRRLHAAQICANAGFRVGFHFDPIFWYEEWAADYRHIVDRIFEEIHPDQIAWISLGTLRMSMAQKQSIEARFPENTILDAELIPGYDGKLRYPRLVRKEIYSNMKTWIRRHASAVPVYLCMEDEEMADACQIRAPFK